MSSAFVSTETQAPISRQDYYFGDNHDFDQTIFDQTLSFFTSDTITLQQAADARLARMYTSNATNPTFNISSTGVTFSFGETAAYLFVFNIGGALSGNANRTFVEYFFRKLILSTIWLSLRSRADMRRLAVVPNCDRDVAAIIWYLSFFMSFLLMRMVWYRKRAAAYLSWLDDAYDARWDSGATKWHQSGRGGNRRLGPGSGVQHKEVVARGTGDALLVRLVIELLLT